MKIRFGLRLMFVVLTLAAVACAVPSIWHQIQFRKFISYANRDLQEMPDAELKKFINTSNGFVLLDGDPLGGLVFLNFPWYVWPVETENQTRYVYLRGSPCFVIPGISSVSIHLFDSWGRLITETEFSTGYRITIHDATIFSSTSDEFIFRVDSEPVINGHDTGDQYYALIQDQFVLVRLEDGSGKPIINFPDHFRIGNHSPEFIVNDWRNLLTRGSRVERLAALEYLQSTPHPDAKEMLRSLLSDKEPWVADAARLSMVELGEIAVPAE